MSGEEENEANRFAADRLIPPAAWSEFQPTTMTENTICDFSRFW